MDFIKNVRTEGQTFVTDSPIHRSSQVLIFRVFGSICLEYYLTLKSQLRSSCTDESYIQRVPNFHFKFAWEKCIQDFCRRTRGEGVTWETKV